MLLQGGDGAFDVGEGGSVGSRSAQTVELGGAVGQLDTDTGLLGGDVRQLLALPGQFAEIEVDGVGHQRSSFMAFPGHAGRL